MKQINTVAYILIENKKILLVKAKNKNAFYMPGGKPDKDETARQTIIREAKEELGIDIIPTSLRYYGTFKAQAYGKEKGLQVYIKCYVGKHTNKPFATSEIEEIKFFSAAEYLSMQETAPAVRLIMTDLKKAKLIG